MNDDCIRKEPCRCLKDWEIDALSSVANDTMNLYIELQLITGLDRNSILKLTISDVREDGLFVRPQNLEILLGKAVVFKWSEELENVISKIRKLPRAEGVKNLFCDSKGMPFFKGKFIKEWGDLMEHALEYTELKMPFREMDVRYTVLCDLNKKDLH